MVRVIAARDRARAEAFAHHQQIPSVVDTYEDVICHDKVDAVYVPLHIPAHHEWTIKALEAGKHVLCEKSLACNAAQAQEMTTAAERSGKVLMEAFHYRYHPVFRRAVEIYTSGVLGEIQEIEAVFHVPVRDTRNIRMKFETGGGVTMDIGCYPISWVRHITGNEPSNVTAQAVTGPPDVDVCLRAQMTFSDGVKATTSGDMRPDAVFAAYLRVTGSQGQLHVANPLVPQIGHYIKLTTGADVSRETFDRRPSYGYQLDAFIDAVENGRKLETDGADAVAQMRLIDRCYEAAGLRPRGQAIAR
jgi:predicted dehydrogenase